jgi:diguanylate cyclase (GGDEF)-like protein
MIRESRYDVILLELNLPDSDGTESVSKLLDSECGVPVVVLSASRDGEASFQTVTLGAQDLLGKETASGEIHARSIHNATQRYSLLAQATAASLRNDLTGFYNRRGLATLSLPLIKAARRTNSPLTMIYGDLDRLKPINHTLGHDVGDRALKETTQLLTSTFRECHLICRLGGDESAILAVGAGHEHSQRIVQRVLSTIDESNRLPEPNPNALRDNKLRDCRLAGVRSHTVFPGTGLTRASG